MSQLKLTMREIRNEKLKTTHYDLHGKTFKHGMSGHAFTLKKVGDHEYDIYKGGKFIGSITAGSEAAVMNILKQKGYDLHE